jgi:hypothetical protein
MDNTREGKYTHGSKTFPPNIAVEYDKYHVSTSGYFGDWYPIQSFQIIKSKQYHINYLIKKLSLSV